MSEEITTTTVQRIQTLAAELETLGKTALGKAVEAGNLLRECKAGLAHGEWLPWLEANFTFADRTARRWMKLAEDVEAGRLKTDTVSNLAEAYRITTEPKEAKTGLCPFEMPLPGQRLVLVLQGIANRLPHYAAIEPMDETYVQVTWTENEMSYDGSGEMIGGFEGTRRGIRRDRAWGFLVRNSSSKKEWENATAAFVPWAIPEYKSTINQNLLKCEMGWLEDCFELKFTQPEGSAPR